MTAAHHHNIARTRARIERARAILAMIARGPVAKPEIAAAFNLSVSTVNQHVREMIDAQLIAVEGRGRNWNGTPEAIVCTLTADARAVEAYLARMVAAGPRRPKPPKPAAPLAPVARQHLAAHEFLFGRVAS